MEKVSDRGHEAIKGEATSKATDQAGEVFDVSGRSVARAKVVLEHGTKEDIADLLEEKSALKPVEKQCRHE